MYSPRIVRLTDEHVPGTTDHSFTRENARKCSIGCCRLCCRKTLHPGCHGLWSSNRYLCFQNSVVISELCSRDWQPPNPASNYSGAGWQSPSQRTKSEKERKETKQLNEKKSQELDPEGWQRYFIQQDSSFWEMPPPNSTLESGSAGCKNKDQQE